MTVQDPNILNPFTILDPSIASTTSLLITVVSVFFCCLISFYFFRSYRFSGFRYLLGLPMGFTILGISFVFEHLSLMFYAHGILYSLFFWVQMALVSEALALIALSYLLKNRINNRSDDADASAPDQGLPSKLLLGHKTSTKARDIFISVLPMVVISIPFMVPISALFVQQFLNYTELADLSFYIRIFNMIILGYIFKSTIVSLVKAANIKLLYVPAAFASLWLEQYSLMIIYFDNNLAAFIGSLIARLVGLAVFIYAIHYATSGVTRGNIEIEAREKT